MDMKHIFKAIITLAASAAVLVSCTKGFEDINKDRFGVTDEQMAQDGLALGGMFQQLERSVIIFRDGTYMDSDYQIMYNLCAETWCGYMAPTLSDGHHAGWDVNDGWHRRMFTVKYEYGMGGFRDFEKAAVELNMVNELALAKVLKVATMHQVTDYYGPIAYSHYGELTNLYDSQESVYTQFLTELDESIVTLEKLAATNAKILEDYDLVYGGDAAKWVRFANSLRLRLAMRIRYANAALARTEAEKSIKSPFGVIVSNNDNAVMSGVAHHPLYEINTNFNDADTQLGASLEVYLNGYNDPRKFHYGKPASDGNLHGVRAGIAPNSWTNYKNTAAKVSAPNAASFKLCWLNAAEVAFLRAEGALVGWNMEGSAQSFYEQGIRLSFEEALLRMRDRFGEDLTVHAYIGKKYAGYIRMGASPRATINFLKIAKASALISGRDYSIPDDVKKMRHQELRHRVSLGYAAVADNVSVESLIDMIVDKVPSP